MIIVNFAWLLNTAFQRGKKKHATVHINMTNTKSMKIWNNMLSQTINFQIHTFLVLNIKLMDLNTPK
jgi:hypothetical protein